MLLYDGTADGLTEPRFITGSAVYRLSLETTSLANVSFDLKNGDTSDWYPLTLNGTRVILTADSPAVNMTPGPVYIRANVTGAAGGNVRISVEGADLP